MANVIKLKRGTSTPTTSDITSGEVALDTSAKKLYVNDGGTVKEIGGGGGGLSSDAQQNTVGGTNAGDSFSGTNATNNTLIGFDAGTAITEGDNNSIYGYDAGQAITTGDKNSFFGASAGYQTTTSDKNVAIGSSCLYQNSTGAENTATGASALNQSTTASGNSGYGRNAGNAVTTGSNNSIFGKNAAKTGTNDLTTGSNNIIIGYNSAASSATVSNEITFGDTNITKLRVPALSFEITASAVTNGAAFYENAKTVAADYTLSGSNAMAAGPITINSGITVTVSSGDTLTIV